MSDRENPKIQILESEIEKCRRSSNWPALEALVAKYRRKYFSSGSALEYLCKAEILLHEVPGWLNEQEYPFDACPAQSWVPQSDVSPAATHEAKVYLKKALGFSDPSETAQLAIDV